MISEQISGCAGGGMDSTLRRTPMETGYGERHMEHRDQYTAAARRSVARAAQYAAESGSLMIGTEHLLLGLCMEKEGAAGVVLGEFGVEEETLGHLISELIEPEADFVARGKGPAKKPGKKRKAKAGKKTVPLVNTEAEYRIVN